MTAQISDIDSANVLRLNVLGPVEVRLAERRLDISAPQTLAILAILAAESGRTLSTTELAARLWADRTPISAVNVVRNHVHDVRRQFDTHGHAGAGAEWLGSTIGGYRLGLPVESDVAAVEELLVAAEADRASGAADLANEKLVAAKQLWRGDPLVGVPGPWADKERARLDGLRSALNEAAIAVTLDLGRYSAAVAELAALVAAEPQGERWYELLMVALYRAGRRAEALEVYRNARRLLINELGLEPSERMVRLHQEILSATPQVYAGELVSPERDLHSPRIPAQLPPDVADFVGRDDLLEELTTVLGTDSGRGTVVAITGMAGLGKTALAVHLAHRVRRSYPDGVLHLDLGGTDGQPRSTDLLIEAALRAFGFEPSELPLDRTSRTDLWRTMVARKRVLLLLDNARDVEHLTPLLPGPGTATVLVTSRSSLAELFGARLVPLDVLTPDAAWTLLEHGVSTRRMSAEPDAAHEILRECGHLPLALRIIGARLASRPTWPLAGVAERLADERGLLAELTVGNTSVELAFLASYRSLAPELANAFVLMAFSDAPELSVAAIAALLDRDRAEAERFCEALVDLGMLQTPELGRYRYHDLLRLFGRKMADAEQRREWPQAMHRLADFYLASAKNIMDLRDPGFGSDQYAATSAAGQRFTTGQQCAAWVLVEHRAVVALYRQVAEGGDARTCTLAVDLALALAVGGDVGEQQPEVAQALQSLSRAAEADGERRTVARAHLAAAMAWLVSTGDLSTVSALRDAGATLLDLDDHACASMAEIMIGTAMAYQRDIDTAVEHFHRAIELVSQDWPASQGIIWATIARVNCEAHRWDAAVEAAEQALPFARQVGNLRIESMALHELGFAKLHCGDPEMALGLCERAFDAARRDGRRHQEGWALARLAEVMLDSEDADAAVLDAGAAVLVADEAVLVADEAVPVDGAAAPVTDAAVRARTEVSAAEQRVRAMQAYSRALAAVGRGEEAAPILQKVAQWTKRMGLAAPDADAPVAS
ncbi:BTAD domain-containing putative transcriptional regulator [Nocardia sp. NPDC060256]|uniref:AfsR/SARP family transcriptional regulator n=1 Tax=unclassified Nocardia TaxID=2637762 RepID=UPI00365BA3CC